jgi:hypothetical protein
MTETIYDLKLKNGLLPRNIKVRYGFSIRAMILFRWPWRRDFVAVEEKPKRGQYVNKSDGALEFSAKDATMKIIADFEYSA